MPRTTRQQKFYAGNSLALKQHLLKIGGLVAYYPLNEEGGLTASNQNPSSLNSYDGTITGATLGANGFFGKGYGFDGSGTDVITVADNVGLRYESWGEFTVICLVNISSWNNNVLPRFWEKGATYCCMMGDSGNGKYKKLAVEVTDSANNVVECWGGTQLVLNTPYLLAFTVDASQPVATLGKIFINGVAETMSMVGATFNGTLKSTSGITVKWFNSNAGTRTISANYVQHLAYFNRALRTNEIARLAQIAGLNQ